MNRKVICRLIVGLLILVAMIMSGCAKEATEETTPANVPPVAQISVSSSAVKFGESITFSGTDSIDSDGSITSYKWDFGDGNTALGETVTYSYSNRDMIHTVILTVTDNDGLSDTGSVSVKIMLGSQGSKIKIEATASSWVGEPYDIYGAIKEKLEEAGFEVVPQETTDYDAILYVDYKEEEGEWCTVIRGDSGYATDITCNLRLEDKAGNTMFETELSASTPFPNIHFGLYADAVASFESQAYFFYLGETIADIFGDTTLEESVIQDLEDGGIEDRRRAAAFLGEIGDAWAVEPLIQALEDKDASVRYLAAEALGKIGDARAVEPLIQVLLEDEYFGNRESAAIALGEIGDERAIEPLTQALNDETFVVRTAAEEALKKIRGE